MIQNMNTNTNTPNKKGRPEIMVTWPAGDFTINDVYAALPQGYITKVAIQHKLNKEVQAGRAQVTGARKSKSGKPSKVYKFTI
jgi:hypothetical protein